jgi:hypothetical protein
LREILLKGEPEGCRLVLEGTSLNIHLKFTLKLRDKARTLNFSFNTQKNDDMSFTFLAALMKINLENALMIQKMSKALQEKDEEILEYRRNNASLVRSKCILN